MIEIRESGELLTKEDIASFERELGCALPRDYQEFLLTHNGGKPRPYWFSYADEIGRIDNDGVGAFFGLGISVPDYHSLHWHAECFKGRIPSELLAVGDDPCGNLICITIKGEQIGQLFLWNHEGEHTPPTYRNVVYLASSFLEFLNGLHEIHQDWETPTYLAIRKDDVNELEQLLGEESDLEAVDQFGRTMLENAAIANAIRVFERLFLRGAKLRNSLNLAEENARFFPEHERMVQLIRHLTKSH